MERSGRALKTAARAADFDAISKLLDKQCRYLRCSIKCESKVIYDICDSREPANLINQFASVLVGSIQDILKEVPGADEYWPPACHQLSSKRYDFLDQPDDDDDSSPSFMAMDEETKK